MNILSPALLLSLGSMLFGGLTWVLVAKASRDNGPLKSLFIFQLVGVPLFIFLLPFMPHVGGINWLIIVGIGIFETFVMLLLFYALQIGEAAIVLPATDFYAIITAILGIVFLHESLYTLKIIGMVGVTIGVILLGLKLDGLSKKKLNAYKGIVPAILAAIGTGIFFFLVTISSRDSGWFWTAVGIRIVIALAAGAILLFRKEKFSRVFKNVSWKYLLPAAAFDVLSFSLYSVAVGSYETSYVTIIFSAQSFISVFMAYLFLKERLKLYQIIGVFVVLCGLILLQIR